MKSAQPMLIIDIPNNETIDFGLQTPDLRSAKKFHETLLFDIGLNVHDCDIS